MLNSGGWASLVSWVTLRANSSGSASMWPQTLLAYGSYLHHILYSSCGITDFRDFYRLLDCCQDLPSWLLHSCGALPSFTFFLVDMAHLDFPQFYHPQNVESKSTSIWIFLHHNFKTPSVVIRIFDPYSSAIPSIPACERSRSLDKSVTEMS